MFSAILLLGLAPAPDVVSCPFGARHAARAASYSAGRSSGCSGTYAPQTAANAIPGPAVAYYAVPVTFATPTPTGCTGSFAAPGSAGCQGSTYSGMRVRGREVYRSRAGLFGACGARSSPDVFWVPAPAAPQVMPPPAAGPGKGG